MNARGRRLLHILVFLAATGLVTIGGLVGVGQFVAGAGVGLSIFTAGLWGWVTCALAMAYWDAWLSRPTPGFAPPTTVEGEQARDAELWDWAHYGDPS